MQRESALANRKDLIEESAKAKMTARELVRLDKQRRLAEVLREKVDARETGEDLERKRNWEYSIEENDDWTKRLEKKGRRADFQFHGARSSHKIQHLSDIILIFSDETQTAHRKYKKDLDLLKPDMEAYTRQKEVALGLQPGALVQAKPSEQQAIIAAAAAESSSAAEYLYRDANTLLYADNKPSEEAIDRVVGKLNKDLDKRGKWSRKRINAEEGDITYINERNKVFNAKVSRYFSSRLLVLTGLCSDISLLRQVHCGDSRELRARNRCVISVLSFCCSPCTLLHPIQCHFV